MNEAKIRLSPTEMDLVLQADWILTKNSILHKTNQLLGRLLCRQQEYLADCDKKLPAAVIEPSPKISKGDNYNGLPYLVLDHPRYFHQSGIFAVRTFFWWGNFFSVTLHLGGHFKNMLAPQLLKNWSAIQQEGFYCCVNSDEWQHHFERNNYVPAGEIDIAAAEHKILVQPFIKLAKKIPLQEWEHAEDMLLADFSQLIGFVAS
jgi:hypothetical protein